MYNLEYIETDEDVRIFEAKEVDPFLIVTNIKFSTHPLWGVSKSLEKNFNLNWNEGLDPFTSGKPNQTIELMNNFAFSTGFYGKAVLDVEAKVDGIKSFSLSAKLNVKCIFGAGIDINNPSLQKELAELLSKDFEIPNTLKFSLLSFKFSIKTKVQVKLDVEDIKLQLVLYKAYYFEFEKEIGVSSELGFINPPQRYEFKDLTTGVDLQSIIKKIQNTEISFHFIPKATLTLYISFMVGETEYSPIYFDLICRASSTIEWTPSKCPSPPLYYNLSITTDLQFRYDGFEVLGFTIIDKYQKLWRILKTRPKFSCLFDPKNVSESTTEGTFVKDFDSYIIKSQYGHFGEKIDDEPAIALSMYLKSGKNTLKGVYMEPQNETFTKGALFDTNKDIVALDVEDSSSYQIEIQGFEENQYLSSRYFGSLALDDLGKEGSLYLIASDNTFSKGRTLGLKMTKYRSVRIDIGKEYTVVDDSKYVCFNGDKDQQTYKMIYKKANEEYVAALSNDFFSECNVGDADKYKGKYTNGGMGKITLIKSIKTGNFDSEEINIILYYLKTGKAPGRFKIPEHGGTETAEELGIQNLTCNMVIDSGKEIGVKVLDNDEKQYTKEFQYQVTNDDILNVSFKYSSNYQIVLFKIEYTHPTIFSEIL